MNLNDNVICARKMNIYYKY